MRCPLPLREPRRKFLKTSLMAAMAGGMFPLRSALADTRPAGAGASPKHTLLLLDPGHFHAALTLRESHPRLNDDVFVYAQDGPDVRRFVEMVESFNARERDATRWRLHVHRGADPLGRLIAERRGDIAVVAGRNDGKMIAIDRLHKAGFHVLGDKPWLIGIDALDRLRSATAGAPLAMDIMTERHQIANRVQKALIGMPDVFGDFRLMGEPALSFHSVHHLYKLVNGRPLVRPPWFFDTRVQGEGITDVTTHLVDLAQWYAGDGRPYDYARDFDLLYARQWHTDVPVDVFSLITGLSAFPPELEEDVEGGTLRYLCNAAFGFRLQGAPVHIETHWNLKIPDGGGDMHLATARGTRATVIVDLGPETGFRMRLRVLPPEMGLLLSERTMTAAIDALQPQFPGIGYARDGAAYRIALPESRRSGHEAHFAAVLDEFIGYVDSGRWPANLGPDLVAKYTLIANARELSLRI